MHTILLDKHLNSSRCPLFYQNKPDRNNAVLSPYQSHICARSHFGLWCVLKYTDFGRHLGKLATLHIINYKNSSFSAVKSDPGTAVEGIGGYLNRQLCRLWKFFFGYCGYRVYPEIPYTTSICTESGNIVGLYKLHRPIGLIR